MATKKMVSEMTKKNMRDVQMLTDIREWRHHQMFLRYDLGPWHNSIDSPNLNQTLAIAPSTSQFLRSIVAVRPYSPIRVEESD
jgi:hypothetical protein